MPGEQLVFVDPVEVGLPRSIMTQCGWMTQKNKSTLGTRDGDVEATVVGQEPNLATLVCSNGGEDNDFFFSTLVPVNALDLQAVVGLAGFSSAGRFKQANQFTHLPVVRRNHPDVVGLEVAHGEQIVHDAQHLGGFVAIGPTLSLLIGFFHALHRHEGHGAVPVRPQETRRWWSLV